MLALINLSGPNAFGQRRGKNEEVQEKQSLALPDSITFAQRVALLFDNYQKNTLSEKLFLHTDKESCLVGDTIWFAAHLTSATTNLPADISRYIYVELTDRSDSIYQREMIKTSDSTFKFSGYMPINESLRQGEYYLRAYTYWQQNNDEALIYIKRIRIVNPFDHKIKAEIKAERGNDNRRILQVSFVNHLDEVYTNAPFEYCIPLPNQEPEIIKLNTGYNGKARIPVEDSRADRIWLKFTYDANWDFEGYEIIPGSTRNFSVSFFPEGGDMIGDVFQRIAFISQGSDGKGVAITGGIYDRDNTLITTIKSNTLGIGSFTLNVDNDEEYFAIVKDKYGTEKRFSLPKPDKDKYAIQLTSNRDIVTYNILCDSLKKESIKDMYITIISRGIPLSVFNAAKMNGVTLNLSNTPSGIIQFILSDSQGKIYSERLWYHKVQHDVQLKVTYDSEIVRQYERAEVPMSVTYHNSSDFPIFASLSILNIGQTDVDYFSGGIEAYQLLTSELKGHIESPGYYFSNDSPHLYHELDNLLLIHGWSRYNTEEIISNRWIARNNGYYIERGQFLSGKVTSVIGKKAVKSDIILMGTNGDIRKVETNTDGRFIIDDISFEGGTRFIAQATSQNEVKNVEIDIDEVNFKEYHCGLPFYFNQNDKTFYDKYGKDYIFSLTGDRIKTLGGVRVANHIRSTEEQLERMKLDSIAKEQFHKGYTNVKTWGHLVDAVGVDGMPLPALDFDGQFHLRISIFNTGRRFGLKPSYIDFQNMIDDWKKELSEVNVNESKQHFFISDDEAMEFVGTTAIIFNHLPGTNAMEMNFAPVVNNITTPAKIIIWDKQTIVPIAPQNKKEYYKPAYSNVSSMHYEALDEIITRYWNPDIYIESDKEFLFSFPTAIGGENKNYIAVINGLTLNGIPIHKIIKL